MVVQVSATTPDALQFLHGWGLRRGASDSKAHLSPSRNHLLSDTKRCSSAEPFLDPFPPISRHSMLVDKARPIRDTRPLSRSPARSPRDAPSSFTFPKAASRQVAAASPFQFSPKLPSSPSMSRGSKRKRHAQDVDGPLTAAMSCKKRRLRTELITSRLSQPFSLPATHILNREGMKSGDKRFFKIAASIDLARRIAHLHATSFLRFSLMNSTRKRLGLTRPGGVAKTEGNATVLQTASTARTPWQLDDEHHASDSGRAMLPASSLCHSGESGSSSRLIATPVKLGTRLSMPAALPRPAGAFAADISRTSPRIHPIRSPELRPVMNTVSDDSDEDSFAFLHVEDDGSWDTSEDAEQVYSDFGVIFGAAAAPADGISAAEHSYEEYLDELDGITWVMG